MLAARKTEMLSLQDLDESEDSDLGCSGERPVVRGDFSSDAPDAVEVEVTHHESFMRLVSVSPVEQELEQVNDRTLDCLGVNVALPSWDEVKEWFFRTARERRGNAQSLFFVNAHTLNLAWTEASFRQVLNDGDLVLNDGIGLELYGRLCGTEFQENFNGTDFFPRMFAEASEECPLRVFLYGALPGRAELAKAKIEARFPGVKVVGTLNGFRRESVIEAINEACPDVLLVGMGNPLQERWIHDNKHLLDVGVVAGVGALIDFLSGEVTRAPVLFRRTRMEWLYRLAIEPKRMFRRYILGNPAFLLRSVLYVIERRPKP